MNEIEQVQRQIALNKIEADIKIEALKYVLSNFDRISYNRFVEHNRPAIRLRLIDLLTPEESDVFVDSLLEALDKG